LFLQLTLLLAGGCFGDTDAISIIDTNGHHKTVDINIPADQSSEGTIGIKVLRGA
jgi:hypothetical protein